MVLSSQSPRSRGGGPPKRKRKAARRRNIALGAILVGGIAWYLWPAGDPATTPDDGAEGQVQQPIHAAAPLRNAGVVVDDQGQSAQQQQQPATQAPTNAVNNVQPRGLVIGGSNSGQQANVAQRDEQPQQSPTQSMQQKPPVRTLVQVLREPEPIAQAADPTEPQDDRADDGFARAISRYTSIANSSDAGPAQLSSDLARSMAAGMKLIEEGRLLEGRRALSDLYREHELQLPARDAQAIRDVLNSVNQSLVFSDRVYPQDPLVVEHKIERGEYLSTIAPKYATTHELISYINNVRPERIRLNQRLKIVRGPFHAVVDKSAYRMDIYASVEGQNPLYITSFPVGTGEQNSTPVGQFIIAPNGKIPNPSWTNPRTGQKYEADNPENPIGDFWLGLQGADNDTKGLRGYGIHGTIDPASIGHQASMGCIRLHDEDIEMVYRLLVSRKSTVFIRP